MMPRPRQSILFPYTTLFRSYVIRARDRDALRAHLATAGVGTEVRSEEHTSELQSHSDLVCRLLLEKKMAKCLEYRESTPSIRVSKSSSGMCLLPALLLMNWQ